VNLTQLTAKVMGLANRIGQLDSWHLLALDVTGAWTNAGAGPPLQYRYTADNGVWIVANLVPGTRADGTTLFTLPAGYRPQGQVCIAIGQQGSSQVFSGAVPSAFLAVNPSGVCSIFGVNLTGTLNFLHINAIVPLDALN